MKLRRSLARILILVVVAASLILPTTAAAGKWVHDQGKIRIPRDATEAYTVSAGEVSVTIFPGCLPEGGPVNLIVFNGPDGQFRAQFSPEYEFDAPVMMDFGSPTQIVYNAPGGDIVLTTTDLDGDGEPGEIMIDHFSRYSGWH